MATATTTSTTTKTTFLSRYSSRMSISEQSMNLDRVIITLLPDIGNSTVMENDEAFYKYIRNSVLDWMLGPSSLVLSNARVMDQDGINNIATVFQAVLKGDGIFTDKISNTDDSTYDRSLLVSFLEMKISDDTLFSKEQCVDIHRQLVEAKKIQNGTLTMNEGDQMGIVIVIEGPWGVKITIYIKW
jgi:hypothetical protein